MMPFRFECYLGALDLSNCIDSVSYDVISLSLHLALNDNATPIFGDFRLLIRMPLTELYNRFFMLIPHGFSYLNIRRKASISHLWTDDMILRLELWRWPANEWGETDDLEGLKELTQIAPLPVGDFPKNRKRVNMGIQ